MKQFIINLFKIERYFYISCVGFDGKNNLTYNNSWIKVTGNMNFKQLNKDIMNKFGFDGLHIVNIIAISKKQYNELNNGN